MISIVTSTYNRAGCISRAIESVINQSYSSWQLCVVGDCTQDNTEEVVCSYNDERITFYNLPEKSPVGAHGAIAKNYAIEHMAKGEYIAYLDDDDAYLPHFLETMIGAFKKNNGERLCYCRSAYRNSVTGKRIYGNPFQSYLHKYDKQKLQRYNYLNTNGVVHEKSLIEEVGGWNPRTFFDDYDLWLRMNKVTDFCYVNKSLVITYLRDESPFFSRMIHKGFKMLKAGGKRMPLPYDGDYGAGAGD